MLKTVCGNCTAYQETPLFFDRSKSGKNPKRTSEIDLKTKISDDVHFHLTITGRKEITVFQKQYQFVQIVESPGSAFIVVDQTKLSQTSAMFASILGTWPVFLMAMLMANVAGMFIWVFVSKLTQPFLLFDF